MFKKQKQTKKMQTKRGKEKRYYCKETIKNTVTGLEVYLRGRTPV
jgi:hypothetical protein